MDDPRPVKAPGVHPGLLALPRTVLPPVLVFVVAVATMEVVVRHWHVSPFVLPPPSAVGRALVDKWADLRVPLARTAEAAGIGFASSTVVGLVVAVGLSLTVWGRRAFFPYAVFFQTVPLVAVAPMLVIWVDDALVRVSIAAFVASVFPVVANGLAGLRATDPALVDLFRLYRAGPVARVWKLRLPAAIPSVIAGMRVAAGLAVIGAVVGEISAGAIDDDAGLGNVVLSRSKYGEVDVMFAAVVLASGLGLALFAAVNLGGHLLLRRWHASER